MATLIFIDKKKGVQLTDANTLQMAVDAARETSVLIHAVNKHLPPVKR